MASGWRPGFSSHLIQPAQMCGGRGLTRKLVFQVVGDASKSSPPDLAQNRVFAWKIAKESGLADFEGLHNIFNARLLVSPLAEQSNRSIDDLLTETCFLAFPDAERFSAARPIAVRRGSVQLCCKAPSCR